MPDAFACSGINYGKQIPSKLVHRNSFNIASTSFIFIILIFASFQMMMSSCIASLYRWPSYWRHVKWLENWRGGFDHYEDGCEIQLLLSLLEYCDATHGITPRMIRQKSEGISRIGISFVRRYFKNVMASGFMWLSVCSFIFVDLSGNAALS